MSKITFLCYYFFFIYNEIVIVKMILLLSIVKGSFYGLPNLCETEFR